MELHGSTCGAELHRTMFTDTHESMHVFGMLEIE